MHMGLTLCLELKSEYIFGLYYRTNFILKCKSWFECLPWLFLARLWLIIGRLNQLRTLKPLNAKTDSYNELLSVPMNLVFKFTEKDY